MHKEVLRRLILLVLQNRLLYFAHMNAQLYILKNMNQNDFCCYFKQKPSVMPLHRANELCSCSWRSHILEAIAKHIEGVDNDRFEACKIPTYSFPT